MWSATFLLGTDRVEGNEPRLEEGPIHGLQRLVQSPVQVDLVIQSSENVGDGALLVGRRDYERECRENGSVQVWHSCTMGMTNNPLPNPRITQIVRGK